MTTTTPVRAAALVGVMVVALLVPWQASVAGDPTFSQPMQSIQIVASDSGARQVLLGMGKSLVIDLPRDIKDVLVADPKVANVVVRSSRRAYVIGGDKAGATNVFFFDTAGKQMAALDISISRDVNIIRTAIRQIIPNADINVESVGDGILLSGTVASQAEAQQAYDVASHFVEAGDGAFSNIGGNAGSGSNSISLGPNAANGSGVGGSSAKIINAIVVRQRDQIMLKVTVAEIERDVVKQLGINFSGSLGYGSNVVNFNNTNPFSSYGQSLSGSSITGTVKSVSATLQAMEQAGVIHTLAEPSLTAISGETATFMAGGEFPVLNGFSCSTTVGGGPSTCQPSIDFKKFGVALNFTPVVLSEGRISLKVVTEVSDLSSQNSLTITEPGSNNTAVIPSIRTRRADTTVEIPSGGSLAMAGMIQDQTKHSINGLPGLAELPILGPLFKSNDFVNQRTELMILVTPYVVRAVATKELARPDDGFADPSDPSQVLLGKLNRIYGVGGPAAPPPDSYNGKLGFILD
jgi:pilus assembly protein CpaC